MGYIHNSDDVQDSNDKTGTDSEHKECDENDAVESNSAEGAMVD
ncbi:MAG: hypothetical protein QM785_10840 [Pyrinomonadaceae bacterium]